MGTKESMGAVIRRLRTERGWTQEALAEKLHLTPQAVSRWETELSLPDVSQVPLLARTFGVTTDTLYGMEEPEEDWAGPALALSVYGGWDPAAALADWERLASEQRSGELGNNRSLHRWAFLSLALKLSDPESPVYLREKAEEVRKVTLELGKGFPEAEPIEAWEVKAEYRRQLSRLYALNGEQKAAFEALGADRVHAPGQLRYVEDGEIWRLLGDRRLERQNLRTVGNQAADLLLDTLYALGDNALALGEAERAQAAAETALRLIPLFCERKEHLPSLYIRARGDFYGLLARAKAASGDRAGAFKALEEMVDRRLAILAGDEQNVESTLLHSYASPFNSRAEGRPYHRALLRRELGRQELAELMAAPEGAAIRERVEAIAQGAEE